MYIDLNKVSRDSKWDGRGIEIARTVAKWSKDQSTQVGAVILMPDGTPLTFAYNGFARGVDDNIQARHERPEKYKWMSHAEENAIANLARTGVAAKDSVLYVTHFPCSGCARKIVQAGISTVVVDMATMDKDFLSRWEEDMERSRAMFNEGGVELVLHGADHESECVEYHCTECEYTWLSFDSKGHCPQCQQQPLPFTESKTNG